MAGLLSSAMGDGVDTGLNSDCESNRGKASVAPVEFLDTVNDVERDDVEEPALFTPSRFLLAASALLLCL